MENCTNSGSAKPAPSIFDQLRTVAVEADRQMAALRRARRDPLAFVAHDPTETLLALRGEIGALRRDVQAASAAERKASAALHDLAVASTDFVEQRRADLAAITAYVKQYGYEPPPPPPAEPPAEEAAGAAEPGAEGADSVARPPPAPLDTPEEVQLSDLTVDMLRARTPARGRTPGRPWPPPSSSRPPRVVPSPATPQTAEEDTADASALLHFRTIPLHTDLRPSPATHNPPPAGLTGDAVVPCEVTPGLWVKRRSIAARQPAQPARRVVTAPPPLPEETPAAGRTEWNPDDSPELSAETKAMLARRKMGKM